jgi:predicted metal-dependent hydrolase
VPTAPIPEPSLSSEEWAAIQKGVVEFNARAFFECHDTLEDVWAGVRGPSRGFFQGLIQAAVGFYHLSRENRVGAARLFGRALGRLEPYPERYAGFEVEVLREVLRSFLRWLESEATREESPVEPPRLIFVPPAS